MLLLCTLPGHRRHAPPEAVGRKTVPKACLSTPFPSSLAVLQCLCPLAEASARDWQPLLLPPCPCEALIRAASLSPGEAYLPFAEMSDLRNAVLTGRTDDNSAYQALVVQGVPAQPGSRALPLPPSGPWRSLEKDEKKA